MTPLVIDASIAVKWFIPEKHSINALRLLNAGCELLAPDLIFAEFGNVLWKKWLRQELEAGVIAPLLADLSRMRLRIAPTPALAEKAASIAVTYRRSFYDSIYLALAVKTRKVRSSNQKRRSLKGWITQSKCLMRGIQIGLISIQRSYMKSFQTEFANMLFLKSFAIVMSGKNI